MTPDHRIHITQTGRFRWEWEIEVSTMWGWKGHRGTARSQSSALRKSKRQILWASHPYHERNQS